MAKPMQQKSDEIYILRLEQGSFTCCILGQTPMILNRMSQKAKRELLMPRGRKNAAERASTLKHDPIAEFNDSAYLSDDPKSPTLLLHLASAFKGAMRSAALDMPGAAKSQIGRLTRVDGERIGIFGIPKLLMSVTRSAGMQRTPDIRTRVIVPQWACYLTVSFTKPLLNEQAVANLLAAAGITQGVGDWRPEKGAGAYGQFALVSEDDPTFLHLVKNQGQRAQKAAMAEPEPYDDESAEMLSWFEGETKRRGLKAAPRTVTPLTNGADAPAVA